MSLTTLTFWDLHLHGVAGIDFMHASTQEMVHACERLGRAGIGFFAPTLLTADNKLLGEACARWGTFLVRASRPGFLHKGAATPVGLHLEGPFLNPRMAGAHPVRSLRMPNTARALELVAKAQGHVAIVTVAPELPGAAALIRRLARGGIRVQLGHTLADSGQAARAVRAGARGLTHLHNAMRTHHREPGVLAPLIEGKVTAEIITDGIHVDPRMIAWALHACPGRLYAVSDGCCAIAAPRGKPLRLGSLKLTRRGGAAYVAGTGTLAGGATFLTEHPRRLQSALHDLVPAKGLLSLYFGVQRTLFPTLLRRPKARNHFDRKTLRFLGAD